MPKMRCTWIFITQKNIPRRKLGVETPNVESITIRVENVLRFKTAAVIPSTSPIIRATPSEIDNNPALLIKVSRTRLEAEISVFCQ
jgi:hypothetical protein